MWIEFLEIVVDFIQARFSGFSQIRNADPIFVYTCSVRRCTKDLIRF